MAKVNSLQWLGGKYYLRRFGDNLELYEFRIALQWSTAAKV